MMLMLAIIGATPGDLILILARNHVKENPC